MKFIQPDLFPSAASEEISSFDDVVAMTTTALTSAAAKPVVKMTKGNFHLDIPRALPSGWKARAKANLSAIEAMRNAVAQGRPATPGEQEALILYTGFGASELAQNAFREPWSKKFRAGWDEIGQEIERVLGPAELAAAQSGTQFAHYTPETIIDALWAGLMRLGFDGGAVLEAGAGIGLMQIRQPGALWGHATSTLIELDPTAAKMAALLLPSHDVRCEDFALSQLPSVYDAAIGNPPYSDVTVRSDPDFKTLKLRLHDFFIVKSLEKLRPGAVAAFVTSRGTLDKTGQDARRAIAERADLIAAFRLPKTAFTATAGTEVVTDILFFRRRAAGTPAQGPAWLETRDFGNWNRAPLNEYFHAHPSHILGDARINSSSQYGRPEFDVVPSQADPRPLAERLDEAISWLPVDIYIPRPSNTGPSIAASASQTGMTTPPVLTLAARDREGSFVIAANDTLCQITGGSPTPVAVKVGGKGEGIAAKHADIIRKLIPVRDSVRDVLDAQRSGSDGQAEQTRLHAAYDAFVAAYGPINKVVVSGGKENADTITAEIRRTPNLRPFLSDPDAWLTASIEVYDEDNDTATKGPIFSRRVIEQSPAPQIITAADALNVVLNRIGRTDIEEIGRLIGKNRTETIEALGDAVYENPETGCWETADAYLSGAVRRKLGVAKSAALADPRFGRNVEALTAVIPPDLKPSEVHARLGAPWIPTEIIALFGREILGATNPSQLKIHHLREVGTWTVEHWGFDYDKEATVTWGTGRRNAVDLLEDALNARTPEIHDKVWRDSRQVSVLNEAATEEARDKLDKIKRAFETWIWQDPVRAQQMIDRYNSEFNDLRPRTFDGSHLTLPGSSKAYELRPFQKRAIWRAISAGNTYLAHRVGAGKTLEQIAIAMELRRLGLASKPMMIVPGHVLKQVAREWLAMYPAARILVADEVAFDIQRRRAFLAQVATGDFDGIVLTHSAFKLIRPSPEIEAEMVEKEINELEYLISTLESGDRISRKRLERLKSGLRNRLYELRSRKTDNAFAWEDLGIDFLLVDEAHLFRKLSFVTNAKLKGIDPDGSQMAWDLFVKTRVLDQKRPGRCLVLASGTPITNTIGELYTAMRLLALPMLEAKGIHNFDAWAAVFADARTSLEMQPNGKYKPVTRLAKFVNLAELHMLFRSVADVVGRDELRGHVTLPAIATGGRQIVRAPTSDAFREFQKLLDKTLKQIEERTGSPKAGEENHLTVITAGRHAAIDLRLVEPSARNEPDNKLNTMIRNVHQIWQETAQDRFTAPDGSPYPLPGGIQLVFSDLGTLSVEDKRGFSAYRWIRDSLIQLGVPAGEIAFAQDYSTPTAKAQLQLLMNTGKVRITIGSTATMGTGINVQARLKAIHHLDVPYLPADVEQREGRGERQGNQYAEIGIFCYAAVGSLDATSWGILERKAYFIEQALSGNIAIREVEDVDGSEANQFAVAKAIASGDERLLQKAGLEAEVSRLRRLARAHLDNSVAARQAAHAAEEAAAAAERKMANIRKDIVRRDATAGHPFRMEVNGQTFTSRGPAGENLLRRAGRLLRAKSEGREILGSLRGFPVSFEGWTTTKGKFECTLQLERSGQSTELRIGAVSKGEEFILLIEQTLDRFEQDLIEADSRRTRALANAVNQRSRAARPFEYASELAKAEADIKKLEHDLAQTEETEDDHSTDPNKEDTAASGKGTAHLTMSSLAA